MWFTEEPSNLSMGQTAQSPTCSIMEKPHIGLDDCPRILLSCVIARKSASNGRLGYPEGILTAAAEHCATRNGAEVVVRKVGYESAAVERVGNGKKIRLTFDIA